MSNAVNQMFKKLSRDKNVILSAGKLNALKDCIVYSPDMAFVSSRILDIKMQRCPDIRRNYYFIQTELE